MKRILLALAVVASAITPSVASAASTPDILTAQDTLINCWSNHITSPECTTALKVVRAFKGGIPYSQIVINKNILLKCVYSSAPHTPACQKAAKFVYDYESAAANDAQTKADVHEVSVAIAGGIGTGDLKTSDNSGKTALKGEISYMGAVKSVGNAVVYVNANNGTFCVSETSPSGAVTWKITDKDSQIVKGTPCKSVKG